MKTISSRPFLSSCIALMSAIFISACGDDNSSSATDSPIESSSSIEYIELTINSSADSDSVESSSRHTISSESSVPSSAIESSSSIGTSSSTTTVSSSSIESSNSNEVTSSSSTKKDTVVVSSSSKVEDKSSSSINDKKEESSSSMEKKNESSSSEKVVLSSSSSEKIVNSSSSDNDDYIDKFEPKNTIPTYVELDELKLNGFRVENNIAYLSWENNTNFTMQINVEYHIFCTNEDEDVDVADSTIMYTIKANSVKEKAIFEIKNDAKKCAGYVKTLTATENDKSNFAGWVMGSDRGIEDITFEN